MMRSRYCLELSVHIPAPTALHSVRAASEPCRCVVLFKFIPEFDNLLHPKTVARWPESVEKGIEWSHPCIERLSKLRRDVCHTPHLCWRPSPFVAFVVALVDLTNHIVLDALEEMCVSPTHSTLKVTAVIVH